MRPIARLVVVLFVATVTAGPTASAGDAEFTFRENDVVLGGSRTIHVSPSGGTTRSASKGPWMPPLERVRVR